MKSITVLFISTYVPRPCGIGTFTHDLRTALMTPGQVRIRTAVAAMDDPNLPHFRYPKEVTRRVRADQMQSYLQLAEWINRSSDIDLVHIQHEYGIFGGRIGEQKQFITACARKITKPIITTFHTIEHHPLWRRQRIIQKLTECSERVITMSERGAQLLRDVFDVPRRKIVIIPHGVPSIPFVSGTAQKKFLGWQDDFVLSSFGLIRPGKGYEYVIQALPAVLAHYPEVRYAIIGKPHRAHGESAAYHSALRKEVKRLGLNNRVFFVNHFCTERELIRYLQATDIYIASGLVPKQIVSGTVSWAMAAGRPIVSIRTEYTREVLARGRGIFVDFKSPQSFATAILWLIEHPKERKAMGKHAYAYMRKKSWKHVARLHEYLYRTVCQNQ